MANLGDFDRALFRGRWKPRRVWIYPATSVYSVNRGDRPQSGPSLITTVVGSGHARLIMPLNLVQRLLLCLNDLDVAVVAGIGVETESFRLIREMRRSGCAG